MKFLKILLFSLILNFVNSEVFSMRITPIKSDIADEGRLLLDNLENIVADLMVSCESNDVNINNLNNQINELFNVYVKLKELFKKGTFSEKIHFNGVCITIIERMRGHRVVEFIDNYISQNDLNDNPYATSILSEIR